MLPPRSALCCQKILAQGWIMVARVQVLLLACALISSILWLWMSTTLESTLTLFS